jgi:hypothetical protein
MLQPTRNFPHMKQVKSFELDSNFTTAGCNNDKGCENALIIFYIKKMIDYQ